MTVPPLPRPRDAVRSLKPYVPGASIAAVQREFGLTELIKLNQNENPLGPSPAALVAAMEALREAHLYPEGPAPALRRRLAQAWDLPEEWFLVGNGSDEVFRLLAEAFLVPGDAVIVPEPSFAGYPLVAGIAGARVVPVPLVEGTIDPEAMLQAAAEYRAAMVFLCRPNNPTGTVFSAEALRAALPVAPSTLVVLDEAYREFDSTVFDQRKLLLEFPQVIVTRTFSKIYGLAGLRLGYGIMRPEVLEPLMRIRDPFSINLPAVAAGLAALDDQEHRERTQRMVQDGRQHLYALFDRLGLPYLRSEANFVLFTGPVPAADLYQRLLRRGILVRPCGSFGLPYSVRVTVGTPDELARFAAALPEALAGQEQSSSGP